MDHRSGSVRLGVQQWRRALGHADPDGSQTYTVTATDAYNATGSLNQYVNVLPQDPNDDLVLEDATLPYGVIGIPTISYSITMEAPRRLSTT